MTRDDVMEQRFRNLEEFAQYAADMIVMMEEDRRRIEEALRRMEEGQTRRDELLQRVIQAVTVMQADIVRIDESLS